MAEEKCIMSNELFNKLDELGLVPEKCQRMIIDLQFNDIPKIYYQCLGDERLLDVELVNELGIVIREQEKETEKNKV